MRLAIVQTHPTFGAVRENIDRAIAMMDTAPADMYVLPELFNTGYNFISQHEVTSLAEDARNGITASAMMQFAHNYSCYVVYGFAEKDGGSLYNSATIVGPSGFVGVYRKIHLYDRENLFFKPGDREFPVFDLPFGKLGIMICFDWMYPESARTLALKGAQLIAHPSNLVLPHCPDAMVTRCLENRVFAATADRIGVEDRGGFKLSYIGKSEVVSPRGEILKRLSNDKEEIDVVELDLSLANNKRINQYNNLLSDRRPEHYRS